MSFNRAVPRLERLRRTLQQYMRTELRLGRVAGFEGRDGDPALGPHLRRQGWVGAQRYEQPATLDIAVRHAMEAGMKAVPE